MNTVDVIFKMALRNLVIDIKFLIATSIDHKLFNIFDSFKVWLIESTFYLSCNDFKHLKVYMPVLILRGLSDLSLTHHHIL